MVLGRINGFLRNRLAASATEYGILLSLIAMVSLTAVNFAGLSFSDMYEGITGQVSEPSAKVVTAGHVDEIHAIRFLDVDDANLTTPYNSDSAVLTAGPLTISLVGGNGTESLVRNGVVLGAREAVFQKGDLLSIYMVAPAEPEATATVWIDVHGASIVDDWKITTAPDLDPAPFSFADVENVVPSTWAPSNEVQLTEFSGVKPVSAIGAGDGELEMVVNGINTHAAQADVTAGDRLTVRLLASDEYEAAKSIFVVLGNFYAPWTVTTKVYDGTPNAFSFAALVDQELGATVASETVTLADFDGTLDAVVSGDASAALSVNGGAWTTSAAVSDGDAIQMRMTASSDYQTTSTASLAIGTNPPVDWNVTTARQVCVAGSQTWSTPGVYTIAYPTGCQHFTVTVAAATGYGGRSAGAISFDYAPPASDDFKILVGQGGASVSVGRATIGGGGGGNNWHASWSAAGGGASAIKQGATVLAIAGGSGGAGAAGLGGLGGLANAYGGAGGGTPGYGGGNNVGGAASCEGYGGSNGNSGHYGADDGGTPINTGGSGYPEFMVSGGGGGHGNGGGGGGGYGGGGGGSCPYQHGSGGGGGGYFATAAAGVSNMSTYYTPAVQADGHVTITWSE